MSTPTDPYPNFVPGALADADQVDARFKELYDYVQAGVDLLSGNAIVAKANLKTDALQHFLQLLSDGDHKVGFGRVDVANIDPTNANQGLGSGLQPHGLGVAPVVVLMLASSVATLAGGPNQPIIMSENTGIASDATNFAWWAGTRNSSGSTNPWHFYWLAIS